MATLLTKSLFTTSLGCPRKLYYATHVEQYDNANSDNDFLRSLAEGGIQVGALALHYYKTKYSSFGYHYIETKDKAEALRQTEEAMQQNNVVIAEAAFEWNGCYVRADILIKRGKAIQLIEVKSSSIHELDAEAVGVPAKGEVNKGFRKYIYDLAFQKYVVDNALGNDVDSYLMLINSDSECDIDGLNQMVRINTKTQEVDVSCLESYTPSANEADWLLLPCDMNVVCRAVIAGQTAEQKEFMGASFTDYVDILLASLRNNTPLPSQLSGACKGCEFCSSDPARSGFHHCWKEMAHFSDADFDNPLLLELWGGKGFRKLKTLIKEGKYFLADLQWNDIANPKDSPLSPDDAEFNPSSRRQLQITKRTSGDTEAVLLSGIKDEIADWKFPLHFIDFETSTVAIPFNKGRYPYETIAFQYSHHQLDADGTLTHTEWISTEQEFPNFKFIRALKADLDKDGGTIFRYSHHENSVLNQIAEQLRLTSEADREELIDFIHSITHDTSSKRAGGERDMVDLCEVVVRYFYDPSMKGSNSIKVVLPAVLRSKELQKKYAKPYREYVASPNYAGFDFSLINYDANGGVENPYKHLPTVGAELLEDGETTDSEERINNGGLANANYAKLQYDGLSAEEKLKLKNALLRYCELDTMAMVLIYEYFKLNI